MSGTCILIDDDYLRKRQDYFCIYCPGFVSLNIGVALLICAIFLPRNVSMLESGMVLILSGAVLIFALCFHSRKMKTWGLYWNGSQLLIDYGGSCHLFTGRSIGEIRLSEDTARDEWIIEDLPPSRTRVRLRKSAFPTLRRDWSSLLSAVPDGTGIFG